MLIVMAVVATNVTVTSQPPNFQIQVEPHGLDDMALQAEFSPWAGDWALLS